VHLNTEVKRALVAALCLACVVICACGVPREYRYEGEGAEVTGVEIFLPSWSMRAGEVAAARLLLIFTSGGKAFCEEDGVSWESSDAAVASIEEEGSIKALSPGAVAITARMGHLSASRTLTVNVAMDCSQMLLGEVLYDVEGEPAAEFLEIANRSDCECEVSGWHVVDGTVSSTPFVFPADSVIAPHGVLVVAHSIEGFHAGVEINPLFGDMKFALNNSGETVFLYTADGTLVDCIYIEEGSDSFPAPEGWGSLAAARGISLQRLPSADTDTAADWMSGEPTPGR
jgi:hypothetical protein